MHMSFTKYPDEARTWSAIELKFISTKQNNSTENQYKIPNTILVISRDLDTIKRDIRMDESFNIIAICAVNENDNSALYYNYKKML